VTIHFLTLYILTSLEHHSIEENKVNFCLAIKENSIKKKKKKNFVYIVLDTINAS
jgi:hypothetical protein